MNNFLSYLALRTVFTFASTAFALMVIMLALNIITVDEASVILKLSPEATSAFKLVISRIQEVTGNILDIISQLLTKLFGWSGVEVDLNKIKIDYHQGAGSAPASAGAIPNSATPAGR